MKKSSPAVKNTKPVEPKNWKKVLFSTKSLNEVTSLSKVLAAVIFISLPFVGFALGFVTAGGNLPIAL